MALGSVLVLAVTRGVLSSGGLPLSRRGLGTTGRCHRPFADVGVVQQQPVDGRGGEGLGHELVESGEVQVGGDRDGTGNTYWFLASASTLLALKYGGA